MLYIIYFAYLKSADSTIRVLDDAKFKLLATNVEIVMVAKGFEVPNLSLKGSVYGSPFNTTNRQRVYGTPQTV